VNTKTTKNAVVAYFNGVPGMNIEEIILMMCAKATVKCIGLMAVFIKVNGIRESSAAMENSLCRKKDK
jgi:hypothetical protein